MIPAEVGGRVGQVTVCGPETKPTERELDKYMREANKDWSLPLYPSGRGFRYHMKGSTGTQEWARMLYGERSTDEMQLRDSSKQAYELQELWSSCLVTR